MSTDHIDKSRCDSAAIAGTSAQSVSCALVPGADGDIVIDGFHLSDVLSEDLLGISYAGHDLKTGSPVVIREYFPAGLARRGEDGLQVEASSRRTRKAFKLARERFESEAQMLAGFDNDVVSNCHGLFQANGTSWQVSDAPPPQMRSIRQWIEQDLTALDDAAVRNILRTVLPVLADVHGINALHRAVTPDNIWLDANGQVMLGGFGAACYMVAEKAECLNDVLVPGYAPFEFFQRRDNQGPCSDLYSLGATLYYAMTGIVPACAISRFEAAQHRDADPLRPLSEVAAKTHSADLVRIVDWMLSLRVQDRPTTAHTVLDRLESTALPSVLLPMRANLSVSPTEAVASESQSASTLFAVDQAARTRRKATAAVVATLFCIIIFGFGGMKVLSPDVPEDATIAHVPTPVGAPVKAQSDAVESLVHAARDAMREGLLMDTSSRGALVLLERALGEEPDNALALEGINHMLHFFVEEKQRAESAVDAIGIRVVNRNLRRIRLRHPESRPEESVSFYPVLKPRPSFGAFTSGENIQSISRDFVN